MPKLKSAIVAALTLASMTAAVQAAPTLTLTFKVDNVFPTPGSNTNPTAINSTSYTSASLAPVDLQIEVDATITGLAAGTSLNAVEFDVNLNNPSFTHPATASYGWKSSNLQWTDAEGNANSLYDTNMDGGPSTTDLQGIEAFINLADSTDFFYGGDPADPRPTVGESGGILPSLKLGTFKIKYTPQPFFPADSDPFVGVVRTTIGGLNNIDAQFTTIDDRTLLATPQSNNVVLNAAQLDPNTIILTPEPASLGLLAFGTIALIARHRRA